MTISLPYHIVLAVAITYQELPILNLPSTVGGLLRYGRGGIDGATSAIVRPHWLLFYLSDKLGNFVDCSLYCNGSSTGLSLALLSSICGWVILFYHLVTLNFLLVISLHTFKLLCWLMLIHFYKNYPLFLSWPRACHQGRL